MKHNPEIYTLGEIINSIPPNFDGDWTDLVPHSDPAIEVAKARIQEMMDAGDDHQEALDELWEAEACYIRAHENDRYEVSWPEHVTTPRINGDAWIRRA